MRTNAMRRNVPESKPICIGTGLVVLDAIYDDQYEDPTFLAGGSCCNVLTILSYLGWNTFPLARLGTDPEGDRIIEDMRRWGVSTRFVKRDSEIYSPRIIERVCGGSKPHHKFYLKCEHGLSLPRRKALTLKHLESISDALPRPNVFYFDRADQAALKAAASFKKQGSIIMFEPLNVLEGSTFARCVELADIVKYCYTQSSKTRNLMTDVPLEIQTRGAKGLLYKARFLDDKGWISVDAIPAPRLVDATGSGDWLTAGLIYTLQHAGPKLASSKKELLHSLKFGQTLASINCGFIGARGTMYALDKNRLLSIIKDVEFGNKIPHVISRKSRIKASVSSIKCRVCTCADSN